MPLLLKPFRHRGVLVAVWLAFAVQFLSAKRPGFWRTPYLRYETARTLAASGRDAEAIAEMDRALIDDEQNAGYVTFKGFLEARAGRHDDARQSFSRALTMRPDDREVRLALAAAHVQLGRHAEARAVLLAMPAGALTLEQRYQRQSLFAQMQQFDTALDDTALLDTDLTDAARLREALRWAMGAQSWERVLTLTDRVAAAGVEDGVRRETLTNRALALEVLGRPADALAVYTEVPSPENLAVRARLAFQLKRYDEAAPLYEGLLRQSPDDGEVARNLAYSLERTGRLTQAIDAYRRALKVDDDPELRLLVVSLLNATQAHEDAWKTLSVFPTPSRDQRILRIQVRTAVWSGRLVDAATFVSHVSPLSAEDHTLASDLGMALIQQGQGAVAERLYRRLIDEGTASPEARERYAWWLSEQRRHSDAWAAMRPVSRSDLSERGRELYARSAFWAGDYETASPLLDEWLRDHPSNVEVWRELAEAGRQRKDLKTELRALDAYVSLTTPEAEPAARRAGLLDEAGRTEAALGAYAAVLIGAPDRTATRRDYAYLLERSGRIDDAIREYEVVWAAQAKRDGTTRSNADLALIIARLVRSTGRPAEAVTWFERALAGPGVTTSAGLAVEVAQTEVEAGRAHAAHRRMTDTVRAGKADPEALAFAASAAASAGDPLAAAAHLEALGARRRLTVEQFRWQAGLYRLANDPQHALAIYERLAGLPAEQAGALSAMGDVYFELNDLPKAIDAWSRARDGRGASSDVTLKLARLLASLGRLNEAAVEYERYLQRESAEGLRVELARVNLGAERFDDAERWAREATTSSERGPTADLILAQAMHLQGRVRESYALNNGRPPSGQENPELLALYGQLAAARNQHLRAVDLFDRAIDRGAQRAGELWMWSARSAYRRGDYFRSTERLGRSLVNGIEPAFAPRVRTELDTAVSPIVAIPTRIFGDSNDLSLVQSGFLAQGVPGRLFQLFGELTRGRLTQHGSHYDRTRGLVGVANALVTPTVSIDAAVGAEYYTGSDTLAVARGSVRKHFASNSSVGVRAYRDSMWTGHDLRDPRQFNRVLDLARLGPAFRVQGVSASVDRREGLLQQAVVEVGSDFYQDDNSRQYTYGHYQFVLQDRPGAWTALRPNVYWEHFAHPSLLYFSPGQYVSVGSMWHDMRGRGPWRFESEVNPRMTVFDSRTGFAFHGLLDASRAIGPTSVGGGAFVLYDNRTDYWAWRLAAQVGLRLGR